MSSQSTVETSSPDATRALIRIVTWLLPWLGVLIVSGSIALATQEALLQNIATPRTSASTMFTTASNSNSALTGNSSNAEISSGVQSISAYPHHSSGRTGDIAYVHVK